MAGLVITGTRKEQERSARTRRRLMDAAVDCLAELGYARTTTQEIARRAGVTRGALLHHYPTKAKLLTAACSHVGKLRLQEFRRRFADLAPGEEVADRVVEILWSLVHDRVGYAELELQVAARTDAELRAILAPNLRARSQPLNDAQRQLLGEHADQDRIRVTRDFIIHAMRGLAIAALFAEAEEGMQPEVAILRDVARRALASPAE